MSALTLIGFVLIGIFLIQLHPFRTFKQQELSGRLILPNPYSSKSNEKEVLEIALPSNEQSISRGPIAHTILNRLSSGSTPTNRYKLDAESRDRLVVRDSTSRNEWSIDVDHRYAIFSPGERFVAFEKSSSSLSKGYDLVVWDFKRDVTKVILKDFEMSEPFVWVP
ncbi:hypothetical protein [Cohnella hashimotonis]|uniref:Uncharacterized protein n=1 Tax=Cohnella hashimotonis TaxID=2826895 RepID=A0ABT6TM57_9BACL|nr:hypothetical protein [Cohnella hashimotonis]MDI4647819.1 hypothetical protein [Cohnella hashimotonis]